MNDYFSYAGQSRAGKRARFEEEEIHHIPKKYFKTDYGEKYHPFYVPHLSKQTIMRKNY